MKKKDFYLFLNILNILLCMCMFGMFLVFFLICYIAPNWIAPSCFIVICLLVKIFLLSFVFRNFNLFFHDFFLSKIENELKTNKNSRKFSLILAFCYDVALAICLVFPYLSELDLGIMLFFPIYWTIYTLGGVCMFYISLFGMWKIQDKLKKRD